MTRSIFENITIVVALVICFTAGFASGDTWKPQPNIPQELQDKDGWIQFGVFIGLLVLAPLLFFALLYHIAFYFWCCRISCQACGGSKPTGRYRKGSGTLGKFTFSFFFLIITACLVSSIIVIGLSHRSAVQISRDGITLLKTASSNVLTGLKTIRELNNTIDANFRVASEVFVSVDLLNFTLEGMDAGLSGAQAEVVAISRSLSNISNHLNGIKSTLIALNQNSHVHNSPDPNAVPSINNVQNTFQEITDSINTARNRIKEGRKDIESMRNRVKDELGDAKQQMKDRFSEIEGGKVTMVLDRVEQYVNKTQKQFTGKILNISSGFILTTEVVFYCCFIALLTIGLLGICLGSKSCVKFTACISFFSAAIFVLIGLLCMALFLGTFYTCKEIEPAISRSQSLINQFIDDPQIHVNTSLIVDNLLHCGPKGSVLDVLPGNPLSGLNTSSLLSEIVKAAQDALDSVDILALQNESLTEMDQFSTYRDDMKEKIKASVTDYIGDLQVPLNDIALQLSNYSQFGYNEDAAMAALDHLNAKSQSIGGNDFTLDTIDNLDPYAYPYNQDSTYFSNQKQVLSDYREKRDEANNEIATVREQVQSLNNSISSIGAYVGDIMMELDLTSVQIDIVRKSIMSLSNIYQDLKTRVLHIIKFFTDSIESLIGLARDITSCSMIGTFYESSKDKVCNKISPYSGIVSGTSFITATAMLLCFIFLLPATKRIGYRAVAIDSFEPHESRRLLSSRNPPHVGYESPRNYYNHMKSQNPQFSTSLPAATQNNIYKNY